MADEEIPENIDLRFIASQLKRVLDNQKDAAGRFDDIQGHLGKLEASAQEMQITLAATRRDLAIVKDKVEEIHETQQNHGARLNAIDGRLAIIEKRSGLVKA
jgi:chromosome segregation ATPase